jgi:Glycosyl hydrolases family 38 N-terminal domain
MQFQNTTYHLIPHSHDDLGWLDSALNYYNTMVKHIIQNIVTSLAGDKNLKHTYTEQGYLKMWWDRATPANRQKLRKVVKNG